ncbi:zinc metalloprotease HtpX [Desulfofalx alkaliphila]|uniref:zinc metalloprotease HtpX n=1 Tax=Desulfofalx alkaliphila TaxID=105483 RepID=UPI0004E14782|nr:zinc metalloprotease HtpX [Desulfofalx alkaliphila]
MSNFKAFLLMGLLSILLVLLGNAIGGQTGALIFLLISFALNFYTYYNSDKVAIKMTNSKPISEEQAPQLYAMVRNLADRAGLPMPRLYLTPSPQPNAFATGRNPENSAVAVTEGLIKMLNREELEGVLAHELAHIKNRDVLVGTIAASMAGAITMIANMLQWTAFLGGFGGNNEQGNNPFGLLFVAILSSLAATIIQLAISRSREYGADAEGAAIAGNPHGLANALLKLEEAARQIRMEKANPAASHLFIVNPLAGGSITRLFSTHPPIKERVERLKQMA